MYDGYCADIARLYDDPASLSGAGGPVPLGLKQRIPATSSGFTHGYITTSTGALVGDSRYALVNPAYDSTLHESFGLAADAGEQLWLMVANNSGSTIERGTVVKWAAAADDTNLFSIIPAAGGEDMDQILGVAQFDIPTGKAAFILAYGPGVALAGETAGSGKRGDGLTMDAAAPRVIEQTNANGVSFGRFLADAVTDGSLVSVFLNCRGV
jgi:hypothetical protein